jgi:hypothetical protein
MIAALCLAYPSLDPRTLPGMRIDTARFLVQGRVDLMRRIDAARGSGQAGEATPRQQGIAWDEARPGPGGTTVVPIRGFEGLKQFLSSSGGRGTNE